MTRTKTPVAVAVAASAGHANEDEAVDANDACGGNAVGASESGIWSGGAGSHRWRCVGEEAVVGWAAVGLGDGECAGGCACVVENGNV